MVVRSEVWSWTSHPTPEGLSRLRLCPAEVADATEAKTLNDDYALDVIVFQEGAANSILHRNASCARSRHICR